MKEIYKKINYEHPIAYVNFIHHYQNYQIIKNSCHLHPQTIPLTG